LEAHRSGDWVEDPWIVAEKTFSPCYLGGWTACEHWGFTEQSFREVAVMTARSVRERNVEIQRTRFRLKVRSDDLLFGTTHVWRGRVRVAVSDPSRTIVDILDDPGIGGGIRHVADVISDYMLGEHRNDALLLEYGDKLRNRTVFKRLGFILEAAEILAPELIAACASRTSSGITLLDPTVREGGRIVKRWNLRANVTLREAGRAS
jgi:predicted transcriptional regulator of viral defense system